MFVCKKCNREFENVTKIASHLSHPKSSCKCNLKDYYDAFLRKPNEGICIYCGNETSFWGLVQGYPNNKCKRCRNKGEKTQELRKKTYDKKREIKKIETGYYNLPEVCEICQQRFESRRGLAVHLTWIHQDVNLKDYYDKYFKKPEEGVCPITGENTSFKDLVSGYCKYKGKGTNSADTEIKEKKKETLFKNYGVYNPCKANEEQRIEKYKDSVTKRNSLKIERFNLINLLRKLTIDKANKLQCQICGLTFSNISSTSTHVKSHSITIKDYYDLFFKNKNEGVCPISNLETTFDCVKRGYRKYHASIITLIPEIKEKSKEFQLSYIRNKVLEEQNKYNVEIKDIDSVNHIGELVLYKCSICSHEYKTRFTNLRNGFGKCPVCFPRHTHKSKGEAEVYDFIKSIYSGTVIQSYKNLIVNKDKRTNLELDIFLPEKNIAVEFNGLYWHSECILESPVNYHLNKLNLCMEKNVFLVQIFEDEWNNKKEIVKNMLIHKLGLSTNKKIHARQCLIKEISSIDKNIFLEKNHIQGADISSVNIGAFYENKLVSVMTFINKSIKEYFWTLSRFSVENTLMVPGIAGRLISYFKNSYTWSKIYTFSDLRYSVGDLYYKIGFKKEEQGSPNYWYADNQGRRIHRFNLRKRPDDPKDIPEWILRQNEGYYRIWDCGLLKFSMTNPNFKTN